MVTYGYILNSRPNDMGGTEVQVRIPSVHGAFNKSDYKGKLPRNYVADDDIPWYPSLESVTNLTRSSIAVLASTNVANTTFIVIGTTGGSYIVTEGHN